MTSSAIGGFTIGESPIGGGSTGTDPTPNPLLDKTIPSYLYQEYADDEDLQGFVDAYNELALEYVQWFRSLNLPIYTGGIVKGDLLDWVGAGLYGQPRPVFQSGFYRLRGPYNSAAYGSATPYNGHIRVTYGQVQDTSDDIYRRCITWNFYKGDGHVFNIRYLKRRIMRFIEGADGISFNTDETYRISVTFGPGGQVNITILNGLRTVTAGAYNSRQAYGAGRPAAPYGSMQSNFVQLLPLFPVNILQSLGLGLSSGVLQLPFQFFGNYTIGPYQPGPPPATTGFVFGVSAFGVGGF